MINSGYEDTPSSWEVVKLGDFVENEKGKKPKNQQEIKSNTFHLPYVDIEAFEKDNIRSYTDGINCRLCSKEDFLMVWDGSRSGLVGKGMNGALGSTLVRISFPHISNSYAFYFLQSKFLQINSRAKGVGIPHVDPNLLWNYEFPIPPEKEQHRIVNKIESLFSKLDKGIESLKTAQEQLKLYRQALLKHAFEGKLTEQWRKDNADKLETAEELLARIKQERENRYQQQLEAWEKAVEQWEVEGKEGKKPAKPRQTKIIKNSEQDISKLPTLPNKWFWLALGENNIDISDGPFGSNLKTNDYVSSGVPVIRLENIGALKFIEEKKTFVSKEKYQKLKRYTVLPDDLVFSSFVTENIRVAIVPKSIKKAINKADCFRVRTYGKLIRTTGRAGSMMKAPRRG